MVRPEPQTETELYTVRLTCRNCSHPGLKEIIDLGNQFTVNFVAERDDTLPRAPLVLVMCENCQLLQLKHTTKPDILWKNYWYKSSINGTMKHALKEVAGEGQKYHQKGKWLDIGANDGTLLSYVPETFERWGCDPAENMHSLLAEHANEVITDYFSAGAVTGTKFDVITSCAMFYDLDNPHQFIADVASSLTDDGIWINQITDTVQMLRYTMFDNCCHEHVCYYDQPILERMYAQHGLSIISTSYNDVNGGSLRVIARKKPWPNSKAFGVPDITDKGVEFFRRRTLRWKDLMTEIITMQKEPIWLYGASTKGMVMLQYLFDGNQLDQKFMAIAERNPAKVGLLMPGPWFKITDEVTMRQARPKLLMVLPWAFKDEFIGRELTLRQTGTTMLFPLPGIELVM